MRRSDWAKVRAIHGEGLATGLAAFRTHPPVWKDWDAGHLAVGRWVRVGRRRSLFALCGWGEATSPETYDERDPQVVAWVHAATHPDAPIGAGGTR